MKRRISDIFDANGEPIRRKVIQLLVELDKSDNRLDTFTNLAANAVIAWNRDNNLVKLKNENGPVRFLLELLDSFSLGGNGTHRPKPIKHCCDE